MPRRTSQFDPMKQELQSHLSLAPREENAILDEIRNDHDLIRRLRITPQELQALSKCALLGTLTCKQDMLFILRQIREATSSDIDHANLLPAPPSLQEEVEQDPVPDLHAVRNRIGIGPAIGLERSVFDGIVQRRIPEHFGILFWAVIVAVALVWNGVIIISRWRDSFLTSIGSQITQVSSTDAWYSQLDRFGVLLTWEAAFVILIVGFVFLRSQRESRRFKIRPSRR
jgi:preprotein translocase subunit SecG